MARFKKTKRPLEERVSPAAAPRSSSDLVAKHLATLRFNACGARSGIVLTARAPYVAVDIQVEANLRRALSQ
jgi:hypothetical protein